MPNYTSEKLFDVAGRKAIVTGGTRGLGLAIAECLLENGCDVAVTSRTPGDLPTLHEIAERKGVQLLAVPCDTTSTESVVEMVKTVHEAFGRIDILVNSAGTTGLKFIQDMDDETWDKVIDTNLSGVFRSTREVARIMIEQRYGRIINISSMKSLLGTTRMGYTAYCSSKGGINMLTKQCAAEMARYGITVNAIAPTFIRTDLTEPLLQKPEFRQALENRIPLGRIGELEDMFGLLMLFASDAAPFVTGQIVYLDGGISSAQE